MIRINLLPASIHDPAKKRNLVLLSLIAWAVIAVVLGGMALQLRSTETEKISERDRQMALAKKVDELEAEKNAIVADTEPVKARNDRIADIRRHNTVYVDLYEDVARNTMDTVRYEALSASGSSCSITAVTRTLDDIALYLQTMLNATDRSGKPLVTAVQLGQFTPLRPEGAQFGGASVSATGQAGSAPTTMPGMSTMPTLGGGMAGTTMPGLLGPSTGMSASTATGGASAGQAANRSGYRFPVTLALATPVPAAPTTVMGSGSSTSGRGGMGGGMPGMGGMGGMMMPMPPSGASGGGMTMPGAGGGMTMPMPPSGGGGTTMPTMPGAGGMTMPAPPGR